jgi:hypothetical protein
MKSEATTGVALGKDEREIFRSEHFAASLVPSSKYPVVISIASVTGKTSASDQSADELEHWYWFTHIVLSVLDSAFGTTDFETLSAKAPNTTDKQARTLPAVLALKPPTKPAIDFNEQLFWLYYRPRDEDGAYLPLPEEVIERVVEDLRRQTLSIVHSLSSDVDDPS